jgi:hypothetical protein
VPVRKRRHARAKGGGQYGGPIVVERRGLLSHECGDAVHDLAVERGRAGEGLEIPGKLDGPEGRVEDVGRADLARKCLATKSLALTSCDCELSLATRGPASRASALAAAPSFLLNSEHWTINVVRMLTGSAVRAHSRHSAQYCLIRRAERGVLQEDGRHQVVRVVPDIRGEQLIVRAAFLGHGGPELLEAGRQGAWGLESPCRRNWPATPARREGSAEKTRRMNLMAVMASANGHVRLPFGSSSRGGVRTLKTLARSAGSRGPKSSVIRPVRAMKSALGFSRWEMAAKAE